MTGNAKLSLDHLCTMIFFTTRNTKYRTKSHGTIRSCHTTRYRTGVVLRDPQNKSHDGGMKKHQTAGWHQQTRD